MDLYHFHRVLISSAILFFLGFAVYSYRQYESLESSTYLAMTIASGTASIAMVGYLIYFNYSLRRLQIQKNSHAHS